MAGVPEKVLNWLYSILTSEYADVNRTYHDAAEALSHYPSLSPRTEVYTYENGSSALLLLLGGTIPVTFRGATYGFPVAIWIPHAYPRESPIVYVTPSQDMLVRPGQHVSGDGKIYHPYLAQWAKYWDKSTLFDFLAVLRGVFAKEPPVRSKQQQTQYDAPAQPTPPPVPPPPNEWRRSVQNGSTASPSPQISSRAPMPPPKPPKPHEQNRPAPQPQQDRYSQPPPLPPHPPQQQHQSRQYTQPQQTSYTPQNNWHPQTPSTHNSVPRQVGYGMDRTAPMPEVPRPHVQALGTHGYQPNSHELGSPVSPISPEDHRQASRYKQGAPPPQPSTSFARPPQYQQAPPPQQQFGPPSTQRVPQPQSQNYPPQYQPQYQSRPQPPLHQTAPAPINLLDDALEVTIPSQARNHVPIPVRPVPPNPEKDALLRALSQTLVSQLQQTVSSNHAAVAPLRAQQVALQTAYSRLQAELGELQQLDAALASNENILREAMIEADRVMEDARRRKAPDVDDVLVAPTIVGGQLYNLAAEERGIADALFVLGRALDKGRVGADVFVKQTRSLAREQFLKKALIKKIAKGMALDEFQMR
ncbi:UEV domain-containing protein [Massariosphaeria phaeospora]|uniref:UEV domain-containing protein n=1 Tax=Massariosphaeria phaeospora TaxID=100035 RepID=A0A7C8HYN3_9PLEO|nr:UEV domain-containing protein [Massariosphaeria phaeospora]